MSLTHDRSKHWVPTAVCWLVLVVSISTAWMCSYRLWDSAAWQTPINNESDARSVAGVVKAYSDGEITPFGSKTVPRLGMPYAANWNDFPSSDDMALATIGYMARIVGVNTALNLGVLLIVLMNGCAFYGATRLLKYDRMISISLAFAYALPAFAFYRNLMHITVLAYWAMPLLAAFIVRAFQAAEDKYAGRKQFWLAAVFGCVIGMTFIYYSWILMQLVVFAGMAAFLTGRKNVAKLMCLCAAGIVFGVLLSNADTLFYWLQHGTPKGTMVRPVFDGERAAVRLPSLFFPAEHRVQALANWTQKHYYKAEFPLAEDAGSYLGIVGIAGLVALCGVTLRNLWKKRPQMPHLFFWQTLWVFVYACAGGINLVLFIGGFDFFRATNRYSILILALALLFLARLLTRVHLKKWSLPAAVAIFGIVIFDQVRPAVSAQDMQKEHALVVAHEQYFSRLETTLPKGAMVFEMPVCQFPEAPLPYEGKWRDYEGMIPYVYTKNLRFSYGTDKGRGQEMWQFGVSQMAPAKMVEALSGYGFSAILIDRRFFEDGATALIAGLRNSPAVETLDFGHPYYIAFKFPTFGQRMTPPPYLGLGKGFSAWEQGAGGGLCAWGGKDAQLTLTNFLDVPLETAVSFQLLTLRDQSVTVTSPVATFTVLSKARQPVPVNLNIKLKPGVNIIKISGSLPPDKISGMIPGVRDDRMVSVSVWNPAVSAAPMPVK